MMHRTLILSTIVALAFSTLPAGAIFYGFTPEDASPPAALPVENALNAFSGVHFISSSLNVRSLITSFGMADCLKSHHCE